MAIPVVMWKPNQNIRDITCKVIALGSSPYLISIQDGKNHISIQLFMSANAIRGHPLIT